MAYSSFSKHIPKEKKKSMYKFELVIVPKKIERIARWPLRNHI